MCVFIWKKLNVKNLEHTTVCMYLFSVCVLLSNYVCYCQCGCIVQRDGTVDGAYFMDVQTYIRRQFPGRRGASSGGHAQCRPSAWAHGLRTCSCRCRFCSCSWRACCCSCWASRSRSASSFSILTYFCFLNWSGENQIVCRNKNMNNHRSLKKAWEKNCTAGTAGEFVKFEAVVKIREREREIGPMDVVARVHRWTTHRDTPQTHTPHTFGRLSAWLVHARFVGLDGLSILFCVCHG